MPIRCGDLAGGFTGALRFYEVISITYEYGELGKGLAVSFGMVAPSIMTRVEATVRWGISRSTLIRAEGTSLTPIRGADGDISYATSELEALAAKKRRRASNDPSALDGESVAAIFDSLAGGASLADVVRKFRLHPDLVETIAERWRHMKATTLALSPREVGLLLEEFGVEDPPSVGALTELLAVAAEHRKKTTMKLLQGSPVPDGETSKNDFLAAVVGRLEKEFRHELTHDEEFVALVAAEAPSLFENPEQLDDAILWIWQEALRRLRAAHHRRNIVGSPAPEQPAGPSRSRARK